MNRQRIRIAALWLCCVALATVIVARARYITDLSAFLPAKPTPVQQLLVDQLRDGPASRLILIAIERGNAAARTQVTALTAARLRNDPQFSSVNDGEPVTAQRDRKLLPIGSVSQQTVDDAEAAERSALAKVQADQAAVDGARINLGYTKVTSPISGIAGQQQVTAGALVGSGTSDSGSSGTLLTTVQQLDPLYVNFTISAADLITLRQAQSQGSVALATQNDTSVQVVLPNGRPYDQVGTLDFSDVEVNSTTGAVNLRAKVPNPQHQLLPGMYVSLTVGLGTQNNVFLIPQQAIQRDTVGAYAMVVGADGKAARKDVTATDNYRNSWIVTGGLASGDQVSSSGGLPARGPLA